mmetsp:Transcript_27616/g.20019  ORF Transcript_27616/g.20019 Transcript_27616/m.20019 type:complete len:353 (+) Transcript_27616:141-1199(+)
MTFSQKFFSTSSKSGESVVIDDKLVSTTTSTTSVSIRAIRAASTTTTTTSGTTTATATSSGSTEVFIITTLETEQVSVGIGSHSIGILASQIIGKSGLMSLLTIFLLNVLLINLFSVSNLVLDASRFSVSKEVIKSDSGLFLLLFFDLNWFLNFLLSSGSFFLLFLGILFLLGLGLLSLRSFILTFFLSGLASITPVASSMATLAVSTSELVSLTSILRVSILTGLTLVSLFVTTSLGSVNISCVSVLINLSGTGSALSATFSTAFTTASTSAISFSTASATASSFNGTASTTATLTVVSFAVSDSLESLSSILSVFDLNDLLDDNLLGSLILLSGGSLDLLCGFFLFNVEL